MRSTRDYEVVIPGSGDSDGLGDPRALGRKKKKICELLMGSSNQLHSV